MVKRLRRFAVFGEGSVCPFREDGVGAATESGGVEWCEASGCELFFDDVRALYEEYVGRDVNIHCPPTEQPYGIIYMDLIDLNGYVLRFNEASH